LKNVLLFLKYLIIASKQQVKIPIIEEEVLKLTEKIEEDVPQLSKEDKKKLAELNEKVQSFLRSSKIRYWIKDKKTEKVRKELKKILK